jgi:hypothetical protein
VSTRGAEELGFAIDKTSKESAVYSCQRACTSQAPKLNAQCVTPPAQTGGSISLSPCHEFTAMNGNEKPSRASHRTNDRQIGQRWPRFRE